MVVEVEVLKVIQEQDKKHKLVLMICLEVVALKLLEVQQAQDLKVLVRLADFYTVVLETVVAAVALATTVVEVVETTAKVQKVVVLEEVVHLITVIHK